MVVIVRVTLTFVPRSFPVNAARTRSTRVKGQTGNGSKKETKKTSKKEQRKRGAFVSKRFDHLEDTCSHGSNEQAARDYLRGFPVGPKRNAKADSQACRPRRGCSVSRASV